VSQTEGEPLPELETAAKGDADDLVPALKGAADELGVKVRIVDADEWDHGDAKGICKYRSLHDLQPVVGRKPERIAADLAVTLVHEYAHALLHFDIEDEPERAKREVEAEAVAYIVGRYFGLDTSGSAFYLAAWQGEPGSNSRAPRSNQFHRSRMVGHSRVTIQTTSGTAVTVETNPESGA